MQKEFKVESLKLRGLIVFCLCSLFLVPVSAQELLDYPLDTVKGEEVYRYEVERSIGLYRIGVNFNVTANDIVRLNPQLRDRGLHYGETLFIPTGRKVEAKPEVVETAPRVIETRITETRVLEPEMPKAEEPKVTESKAEEPVVAAPATADTVVPAPTAPDNRKVIELALMLPFESQQIKRSANAERMTEFYQGALLALYNLQNDSTLYRLRVYDTERSERRVAALCESNELDSVRGIIGLAYSIQIERMANWCDAHKVPLLLPFSDDSEVARHPYMLQFNSTDEQKADSLCRWIAARNVNCITVEAREAEIATFTRALRKQLKRQGVPTTAVEMSAVLNDSAMNVLDPNRENLIILHSDRFMHVRALISHLVQWQEAGYKIRLVSQYSWQKERIVVPQVFASMFTGNADRQKYEALWDKYYSVSRTTAIPRYDLLGYDMVNALIAWLNGQTQKEGIQSVVSWQQVGQGGCQNANVQIVEK